jgi:hypothetical protein
MRHEHERRDSGDKRLEAFRVMLASMDEEKILCLEALIRKQFQDHQAEAKHKLDCLASIDDRLLYLEGINWKRITQVAKKD